MDKDSHIGIVNGHNVLFSKEPGQREEDYMAPRGYPGDQSQLCSTLARCFQTMHGYV